MSQFDLSFKVLVDAFDQLLVLAVIGVIAIVAAVGYGLYSIVQYLT